jgi:hypothetical protein
MARERMKKFSALVGMIAVTSMLVLFSLAVPSFLATTAGKVFAVIWMLVAIVSLAGFGLKVFQRKQKKRALAPVYNLRARPRIWRPMERQERYKEVQ